MRVLNSPYRFEFELGKKRSSSPVLFRTYKAYMVGLYFPKALQPYYFANHALYLQAFRSRNASTELNICRNRLLFWEQLLNSLQNPNFDPLEPIARLIQEQLHRTRINPTLLQRLVNYQLLQIQDEQAYKCASHIGRAAGIADVIKRSKIDLIKQRTYMPNQLIAKYGMHFERIWDSRGEGKVNDSVGAYAKRHLELGRQYKLPKNANRALLLAVDTELFLDRLEDYNFDIMDEDLHKTPYWKVAYRVWRKSKRGEF